MEIFKDLLNEDDFKSTLTKENPLRGINFKNI